MRNILFFITTIFFTPSLFANTFSDLQIPEQPQEHQWIYDQASLLSSESEKRINQFPQLFSDEKGISFYALTIPSFKDKKTESVATEVFEKWKIGNAKQGRGLLFVFSPQDKKVRIEVGYVLEPFLTDVYISYIEREQMKPFYAQNKIVDGFEATLELLIGHIQNEISDGAYHPSVQTEKRLSNLTGGAGATIAVTAAASKSIPSSVAAVFNAQASPEAAFKLYLEKDKRNIAEKDFHLFTEETRRFFKKWTITKAQMDNEYQAYVGKKYTLKQAGDRAVFLFEDKSHSTSPFFFRKNSEGWQIDLVTATQVIRFNHRNQWHVVSDDHPYLFAFKKDNK